MKNHVIKKVTSAAAISLAMLAMTGCVGTKYLSSGITDEGRVDAQNIVFPDLDDAWDKKGQFPNSENLSKIRPGVDKDDLYALIGPPHFKEAKNAREWDYILKFYMPDNSVKICQYKVIFDTDYKAQEFYWSPADCPPQALMTQPVAMPTLMVSAPERTNISADALFMFDKSDTQSMLPQGKRQLDELASTLRQYQQMGDSRVEITGHTDYKGDAAYNMNLSTQRARTVANYLVNQGVNSNIILATGAGETQPVQECATNLSRQQEIDCLQPNRRVTLDVMVAQ